MQDEYKDSEQSVIASDFYYANTIMHLSDEAIVDKVKSNLDRCEAGFRGTSVVDYAVLRFPKAVTHFSPGSYKNRPFQVRCCDDTCVLLWCRWSPFEHDAFL
jgi:uncharacterized protein with NAD-binding domain and iron-sulfur cluster